MSTKLKVILSKFRRRLLTLIAKLTKKRGIYYINGPDLLPAPLTREQESEMISRLPFDEDARLTLIEHNLRLVVYIAKRFENTGINIEDLISIGTGGLIKAVNTFCADKKVYKAKIKLNKLLGNYHEYEKAKVELLMKFGVKTLD